MPTKRLIGLVILSGLLLVLTATIYGNLAVAAGGTEEIAGNHFSGSQAAGTPVTYQFRQKPQLRLNASGGLTLEINCDADNIGEQTVELNIEADAPSSLTINST